MFPNPVPQKHSGAPQTSSFSTEAVFQSAQSKSNSKATAAKSSNQALLCWQHLPICPLTEPARWHITVIQRWRQEDQEVKSILGYITSLRPAWPMVLVCPLTGQEEAFEGWITCPIGASVNHKRASLSVHVAPHRCHTCHGKCLFSMISRGSQSSQMPIYESYSEAPFLVWGIRWRI